MTAHNLTVQFELDQELTPCEVPSARILEIVLQAPEAEEAQQRSPLNLALILDRSGSMSGDKLNYVKEAAKHVTGFLEGDDQVALVDYDQEVRVLFPSARLDAKNRQTLLNAIGSIRSGGSTNLSGGWLTGCQQVAGAAQSGTINRALLLTDGLANEGITDPFELTTHARKLAQRGFFTSTFGVGLGFNHHLLEGMANQGEGRFYFISEQKTYYRELSNRMRHGMDELDRKRSHTYTYLRKQSRDHSRSVQNDNTTLLSQLLTGGLINIDDAILRMQSPSPLPASGDFERIEGMLLGLAIGDALGNTTESQLPSTRRKQYGEIRDILPNRHAGDQPVGVPSDDSQMAFWTLEQLIADGGLVPDHLARKFTRSQIFGIGSTVTDFLRAFKDQGQSWERAGQPSAGNGALMRIAPVLMPHLRQPSPGLWADAAIAGMITHNDRASNASCVAFTSLLWECLRLERAPEPEWWVNTFCATARQIEGESTYAPRNPDLSYKGLLWRFVDREVRQAIQKNSSTLEACERWHSGAYLLETVPCALYILARYGDNLEEALIRAVNDTKDNDTIAAIVGAAAGALHGRWEIPRRWIDRLSGRTGEDDDGYIFKLIDSSKRAFWD